MDGSRKHWPCLYTQTATQWFARRPPGHWSHSNRHAVRIPNGHEGRARGENARAARNRRDETCPVSTGGGTRRVQSVREGGGGGEGETCCGERSRRLHARRRPSPPPEIRSSPLTHSACTRAAREPAGARVAQSLSAPLRARARARALSLSLFSSLSLSLSLSLSPSQGRVARGSRACLHAHRVRFESGFMFPSARESEDRLRTKMTLSARPGASRPNCSSLRACGGATPGAGHPCWAPPHPAPAALARPRLQRQTPAARVSLVFDYLRRAVLLLSASHGCSLGRGCGVDCPQPPSLPFPLLLPPS